MTENEYEQILDTALDAGVSLLKCGAETRRVEETVIRIAGSYGMDVRNTSFSLTNGLMVSFDDNETGTHLTEIRGVPMGVTRLDKLIHLNQLSRDVAAGKYKVAEAKARLQEIDALPIRPLSVRLMLASVAAAAFSMMFGASLPEIVAASVSGLLAYLLTCFAKSRISKVVMNAAAGFVMGLVACLAAYLFPELHISIMGVILGAMMPLIPGIAFTNGFRDIGNADYLSGLVRLVDALLIFACMAAGTAIVYRIFSATGPVIPETSESAAVYPWWAQIPLSFVATLAFSYLYQLPLRIMLLSGLTGMAGWMVYFLTNASLGTGVSMFLSAIVITLLSRLFSALDRKPVTVFLVPGIVPIVPGAALFFMVFNLLMLSYRDAAHYGVSALITCGAVVLGIAFVNTIPQKLFVKLHPKTKTKEEG